MSRRLLALLLVLALGDGGLVWALKANGWAIRLVYVDRTGSAFEAPPDAAMRARIGDVPFDYAMDITPTRAAKLGLPRATGADSGLADVEANVRWIRSRFRSGGFYGRRPWRLEEAIEAARDPHRRFYCFSYSAAMVSLSQSQGYPARIVWLDGHITSSVYLPAMHKWVLADALHDVIPYDASGRPLSGVEAHRLLRSGGTIEWRRIAGTPPNQPETFDRAAIESLLWRGDFMVSDGPSTFALRGRWGRMLDLIEGRPRTLQLGMEGQRPFDAASRVIRAALIVWNLLGAVAIAGASRRRAAGPIRTDGPPAPAAGR
jgi:hypothetical protein